MLYYTSAPGATQTTNIAANTPNDCVFIKPGTTRPVWLTAVFSEGRSALQTSITGISFRIETWTTTSSSGGTALTPQPDDEGYQAASHTEGWAAGTVTSGTGGPNLRGSFGCSIAGPGVPWMGKEASKEDSVMLQAGENRSIDLFNVTGGTALPFELSWKTAE
jgi:hypothetical protein